MLAQRPERLANACPPSAAGGGTQLPSSRTLYRKDEGWSSKLRFQRRWRHRSTVAALLTQLVPEPPGPARVAIRFTTTELGWTPVRVLAIRSFTTDNVATPSGVMRQEQHDASCSSDEKG